MTQSPSVSLRPDSDEYSFSSVINRQVATFLERLSGDISAPRISVLSRAAPARAPWRPALVAVFAALVLAGCQAETAPLAKMPLAKIERPVQVQRVAFENGAAAREFVGVVRARYETDLGFRVSGKITERLVNAGDRVRVGDVIARLDPQDLRLQVESAEAELVAATSSLAQAAADLERYTTLKARGYAPVAEFDRKKTANDEAEGRVSRARRALDIARNQLAYADLKADADGVITATRAEPGQVVAVGQAVAQLAHRGEKEAMVALPETWLGDVRQAAAKVRLWSDGDRVYQARLRELSPQADAATRTYAARFTIPDADDAVAYGMTATVTLSRPGEDAVARLPLSAVLNRGKGAAVFVVDDGGALALRNVTVSAFNGDVALVSSGVSNGERIVTLGVQKLEPGVRVRAIEATN
ncbi:MAG: efflux RND transporter periplasmic adaptor subunit [Xanthobacteraceae bacterium]|nr:efflux RND transporter periplasmic adaptor subunit [Xanthobacteraceae bacterium]